MSYLRSIYVLYPERFSLCYLKKVQDMKNIYYIFRGTAPKVLPKARSNLEWTK